MCGIFGVYAKNSQFNQNYVEYFKQLALFSETRGGDASGLAVHQGEKIEVEKQTLPISDLLNHRDTKNSLIQASEQGSPVKIIGHARLATNGCLYNQETNQPVVVSGQFVGVHNGIIVNDKQIAEEFQIDAKSGLDSEILFKTLSYYLKNNHSSQAISELYRKINGTANLAIMGNSYLSLTTNNGSLYYIEMGELIVFASEAKILELMKGKFRELNQFSVQQLEPGSGLIYVDHHAASEVYSFNSSQQQEVKIPDETIEIGQQTHYLTKIKKLKRCSKCILPETMPFIKFDEKGVCSYCQNYQKHELKGKEALKQLILENKEPGSKYDCILALSGGRDSSYALHYIVKELGLNPLTFTYDWGMVTDLARRNISKMCAQLNVENIVVAANIREKRKNIKKNVQAWLHSVHLGTVPLFMAGDKQYFYYCNQVMDDYKIKTSFFCTNNAEVTHFKTGFCGVAPIDNFFFKMSIKRKLQLISFYAWQFIKNPRFLNKSLLDTVKSSYSSFFMTHKYEQFFDYIDWNESEIDQVLLDEYDWEKAADTKETWRIGDGTASFYNYIYYKIAGLTEHDTFKSNLIREDKLSREEAMSSIYNANETRWAAMEEYAHQIGFDLGLAIEKINDAKTYY